MAVALKPKVQQKAFLRIVDERKRLESYSSVDLVDQIMWTAHVVQFPKLEDSERIISVEDRLADTSTNTKKVEASPGSTWVGVASLLFITSLIIGYTNLSLEFLPKGWALIILILSFANLGVSLERYRHGRSTQ